MTDTYRSPRAVSHLLIRSAAVVAAAMVYPAQAEPAYVGRASSLSIVDALRADVGTAMALIREQVSLPLRHPMGLPIITLTLIAATVVCWPLRLWLLARLTALVNRSREDAELAPYAKAVGAIILTTALITVSTRISIAAINLAVSLLPATRTILESFAGGIVIAGFGIGLGRALRSPENKTYRPVQMPAGMGRVIGFYPVAAGTMLGLTGIIDRITRTLGATATSWTIAQSAIILAETAVIAWFLVLIGQVRERQVESARDGGDATSVPAVFGLTVLAWAALAVGLGAMVIGQTRFAMLILQEILWSALVLTTAWLLTRFLDAVVARLFDTSRRAGRFATSVVGLQQARLAQGALIGSAVLTVVVWLIAIALIAAPLQGGGITVAEQVRPAPMLDWARSIDISPRTLAIAAAVLFGGIALTRAFRRWLETRFLPTTALDIGARTSIVTGLGYVGVIIAMLGATSALGVQLERITLIASALSVGIGFGLQSIIQNFVSGLILLIERPVKIGDWVSVSGAEGNIRRIRVRATELATADGGVSIVPNSAFISSTVANRADTLMSARLELSVVVTGCSTAMSARDRLSEILEGCAILRHDPPPRLYLRSLGVEAWTFDLRVYGKAGHSLARVRSDLLFWLSDAAAIQSVGITLA
jgi:potassium efflux system protein